jgi:glyoxylase-like metal-dependent hydrolase (beta-lactamase superfamily II)
MSARQAELIDLEHLGRARVIGCWRVGDVVIDPGPSSCLQRLLSQLEPRPPRVLALTHIHLDHAGATGSLLRRFPEIEVWVHERGAAHLRDPSRLLASVERLYGADMERMWGEVLPVPAERIRSLRGGETLAGFEVAYTPGHASHHVCYLHLPTRLAFAGDVTGVRIGAGPVLPPTPPPDIDLEAWQASLDRVASWRPAGLAITHFGAYGDVEEHVRAMRAALERSRAWAQERREELFVSQLRSAMGEGTSSDDAAAYEQALPPAQSYQGLERYLRGRAQAAPAQPASQQPAAGRAGVRSR